MFVPMQSDIILGLWHH